MFAALADATRERRSRKATAMLPSRFLPPATLTRPTPPVHGSRLLPLTSPLQLPALFIAFLLYLHVHSVDTPWTCRLPFNDSLSAALLAEPVPLIPRTYPSPPCSPQIQTARAFLSVLISPCQDNPQPPVFPTITVRPRSPHRLHRVSHLARRGALSFPRHFT